MSLRSAAAGCVAAGAPPVEIVLIHKWLTAASDLTPPSVDAVGAGNRAAGTEPVARLLAFVASVLQLAAESDRSAQAGRVAEGTPEVEIVFIQLCETAARL